MDFHNDYFPKCILLFEGGGRDNHLFLEALGRDPL